MINEGVVIKQNIYKSFSNNCSHFYLSLCIINIIGQNTSQLLCTFSPHWEGMCVCNSNVNDGVFVRLTRGVNVQEKNVFNYLQNFYRLQGWNLSQIVFYLFFLWRRGRGAKYVFLKCLPLQSLNSSIFISQNSSSVIFIRGKTLSVQNFSSIFAPCKMVIYKTPQKLNEAIQCRNPNATSTASKLVL